MLSAQKFLEELFYSLMDFVEAHVNPSEDLFELEEPIEEVVYKINQVVTDWNLFAEVLYADIRAGGEFLWCPSCQILQCSCEENCLSCGEELEPVSKFEADVKDYIIEDDFLLTLSVRFLDSIYSRFVHKLEQDKRAWTLFSIQGDPELIYKVLTLMDNFSAPNYHDFITAVHEALSLHHHSGKMFDRYASSPELRRMVNLCRADGLDKVFPRVALRQMWKYGRLKVHLPEDYKKFLEALHYEVLQEYQAFD